MSSADGNTPPRVVNDYLVPSPSPIEVGQSGEDIRGFQWIYGRPETGVWSVEDEEQYLNRQYRLAFFHVRSLVNIPANWLLMPEP